MLQSQINLNISKKPFYLPQHKKRFTRKPSFKSQKNSQSRKTSFDEFIGSHYIRTPSKQTKKIIAENEESPIKYVTSFITPTKQDKSPMKYLQRTKAKASFFEVQKNESKTSNFNIIKRLKQNQQQQKQRRQLLELQKVQLKKQIRNLKQSYQKLQNEFQKVLKQKEMYMNQITYLSEISFNKDQRKLQSYRQKYLENQIQLLRNQLKSSKTDNQVKLQEKIALIMQQKYTLQAHYKALLVANQCLAKQIPSNREEKEYIMNSQQYIKLREKYKKFLNDYKQLRIEYLIVKKKLDNSSLRKNQSSILSMTFSSCDQISTS